MPVELSWSTNSGTGANNNVVTFGPVSAGELMILQVWLDDYLDPAAPDGWTLLDSEYSWYQSARSIVFFRVAGAEDTAPVLPIDVDSWVLSAFTGWDPSAGLPIGWAYAEFAYSSNFHDSPSILMPSSGVLLIGLAVFMGNWTAPTALLNYASGIFDRKQLHHGKRDVGAGMTSTQRWTGEDFDAGNAVSIGIPALAAGRRNKCLGLMTHFCPL